MTLSWRYVRTAPSPRCAATFPDVTTVTKYSRQPVDKRNQLVLMMAIDIAVYHIFCIHNPRNLSPLRKERHERAVEWLKAVAAEEISVDGLPLLSEETRTAKSNFLIKSNRKRVNHW